MAKAITVSQYNQYIKQIFEAEELLHNINIIGEVFGISNSRNVIYFSLKDENSAISCVSFYPDIFKDIKEGDKVTITGSPNYYIKAGKLSFNVIKLEKAGQGDLFKKFMELKESLEKEGLFDNKHKIEIPKEIKRISVITSKEGAVIHDIINVAMRRNPSVDILLYPVKVQGNLAENEIASAIEKLDCYDKIDVIVVARGGGSLEDLWAYNTEIVARATYNCQKPIISAVGHETDFTIIDFVSDLRAPTPSAAAELLTVDASERREKVEKLKEDFVFAVNNYYNKEKVTLNRKTADFVSILQSYLQDIEYKLGLVENSLEKLDPVAILKRGYAKVEQLGKKIDKVTNIDLQSNIDIFLSDGKIVAKPIEIMGEKWNTKKQSKNLMKLLKN